MLNRGLGSTTRAGWSAASFAAADLTRHDITIAVAIAVATTALILPFAPLGIDHHHDGIMLKPALDVADGQVLFRDSFSQYGPLSTFIHAWVLAASPTLLALKYLSVLLDAASLGLFYLAWRHVLPRCLAVLAAAIFVILDPVFDSEWILFIWSSDTAMLFQAIAWLAMLRALTSRDPRPWAVGLGLSAVAAFWCRQPVGMSLMGTIGCIFAGCGLAGWRPVAGRWREIIGPTMFAALAATASMVGYLAWQGALGAWWYQNIEWPRRWAVTDDDYWWGRWAGESFNMPAGLVLGLPILVAAGASWAARRWRMETAIAEWIPALAAVIAAAILSPLAPGFLAVPGGGWGVVLSAAVAGLSVGRAAGLVPALRASRPRDYIPSAALAGLSLASLTQLYPVPCQRHLFWAIGPAVGAAVYGLWRLSGVSARAATLLLAVAFLPAACSVWRSASASLGREMVALVSPAVLRGMRVTPSHAGMLHQIDAAIEQMQRADPRRCFTMIGFDALFLTFMDNRQNLSPFYVTWPGLIPPAADAARIKAVEIHRPFLLLQGVSPALREAFCADRRYALIAELPDEYLTLIAPVETAARPSR